VEQLHQQPIMYKWEKMLSQEEIESICKKGFVKIPVKNKRLLFIIPDHTRSAPIAMMFQILYRLLAEQVQRMDFLVALGTHPPLSEDKLCALLGLSVNTFEKNFKRAQIYNHRWDDAQQLQYLGTLGKEEISRLSQGLMTEEVPVTINRMIFDYDMLIILGPTFPHEVVGFSGGNKYFFPGIAGKEIIDMFHWLGALITSPVIIGVKDTPIRRIVDLAAGLVKKEKYCISMVVAEEGLAGLYIGSPEAAWQKAADHSRRLHIVYHTRPFKSVLACAPVMYEDLWTGGKCMYKLEPVVADNGELIIYAPHIKEVSITHGREIEQIGYHVRDFFTRKWDHYKNIAGGILAHATHVKGIGTYENGIEKPRIKVILATQISRKKCREINLEYLNPETIDFNDWKNKEKEGRLFVAKAGEVLYRLHEHLVS
jgi:nickel-dependent lactate racemase